MNTLGDFQIRISVPLIILRELWSEQIQVGFTGERPTSQLIPFAWSTYHLVMGSVETGCSLQICRGGKILGTVTSQSTFNYQSMSSIVQSIRHLREESQVIINKLVDLEKQETATETGDLDDENSIAEAASTDEEDIVDESPSPKKFKT